MTIDLAVRVACLLAFGLVAGRLLRPMSAAARHAFGRTVMAMALLLPLLSPVAPGWSLAGPLEAMDLRAAPPARLSPPPDAALTSPAPEARRDRDRVWPAAAVVRLVWLTGVVLVLAYFVPGYVWLWRARRRSTAAPAVWQTTSSRVAARLGVHTVPEVRLSADVPGPLLAGLIRPTVLVPEAAAGWSRERCHATLLHEFAHVRRRDLHAQALAHLLCAIHWFDPLAWVSARILRREQELCCDDEVLGHGVQAVDYAGELLAISAASPGGRAPTAALLMARPSEMEGRVVAMLGQRPRQMGRVERLMVPLVAMALGVAVAGATGNASGHAGPAWRERAASPIQHPAWTVDSMVAGLSGPAGARAEATIAVDPDARERATLALALTPGDEVVPALLDLLGDPASGVREKAAAGLAWRQHPDIVPSLIQAASDPEAGVREKVVVALALSGDERARAVVRAARTDPAPSVRDKARKLAALLR